MKKALATALAMGLLAGALIGTADARKKPKKPKKVERVMEAAYSNPAIGVPGVVGSGAAGGSNEFGISAEEAFVKVEITDDFGQPVIFTMSQNTDPATDTWEIFGTWCGATEEPVSIAPGIAVRVSVYTMPGPNQPTCFGPATSGKVKATFSNLP